MDDCIERIRNKIFKAPGNYGILIQNQLFTLGASTNPKNTTHKSKHETLFDFIPQDILHNVIRFIWEFNIDIN